MSEMPARQEEAECPSPQARAPMVIAQGLTYRDLQRAILLTFGLILILKFLEPLTTLLLFFLLVFILAAVLNPVVSTLQARGVPRILSAVGLAALFLGFLVLMGWLAVPPLLDQLGTFFTNLGQKQAEFKAYYDSLTQKYPGLQAQLPPANEILQNVTPRITGLLGQVGRYTINIVTGVVSLLLLLVLVIYTVSQPEPLVTGLLGAVPERHRPRVETAIRRVLEQLKNWALGSLILGIIVGLMTGLGLYLIGQVTGRDMPYIFLFSVVAGVGELIPNIGPILSAVPPVLVALTVDPLLGLWVALLFLVIQQLENNLIVPFVMGQSLNLHPVSLIFTVLVMGVLFGLLGAVLAVPVCAIAKVCWEEFYLRPRRTDVGALEGIAQDIVTQGSQDERDEGLEGRVEHAVGEDEVKAAALGQGGTRTN